MKALLLLAALLCAAPAAAGEVKPFLPGSWQDLRAAHAGKPLIVSFWSLTCAPCLAEMPLWAKIRQAHPGLTVSLVATDPLDEAEQLARTLRRFGAQGLDSWAFADDFVERLRFDVDPSWHGELPRSYLIGADGSVQAITGMLDEARVKTWLGK